MQIRVLGVPQSGAKSRVETQIKLCIQLVTDDGDKAQWWSHLKLPEHMVAKDKLKRQVMLSTAPNGTRIANVAGLDSNNMPIRPEKMLFLSARVICASDPSKKVVTCLGCIQREVGDAACVAGVSRLTGFCSASGRSDARRTASRRRRKRTSGRRTTRNPWRSSSRRCFCSTAARWSTSAQATRFCLRASPATAATTTSASASGKYFLVVSCAASLMRQI